MKKILEKKVTSWYELRDSLEELANAGWAFRGQADATWPLESSLTRYLKNFGGPPNEWVRREKRSLHAFKRKAHILLPRTPEEGETLEWLALMQHHGAPTRLLDFSWSPYVAAFFALEKATADAAIWAICSGPQVPNFRGFHISDMLNRTMELEGSQTLRSGFRQAADAEKIPRCMIGEPVLMNQRMITQAGTFLVPSARITAPIDSLLPRASVFKLVLATKSLRKDTMNSLYGMNINNAALFPGIDGLARSLAFELEYKWAVDPQAARRLTLR
jgi:FRG domain-containing protein